MPVYFLFCYFAPLFFFFIRPICTLSSFPCPSPLSVTVSSCKPPTLQCTQAIRTALVRACAAGIVWGHFWEKCASVRPPCRVLREACGSCSVPLPPSFGATRTQPAINQASLCANKRDNPACVRVFFHARRVTSRHGPLLALCVHYRWPYSSRSGIDTSTYPSCCDTWSQCCRARDCSLPFISSSRYATRGPSHGRKQRERTVIQTVTNLFHTRVACANSSVTVLPSPPNARRAPSRSTEPCCSTWDSRRP